MLLINIPRELWMYIISFARNRDNMYSLHVILRSACKVMRNIIGNRIVILRNLGPRRVHMLTAADFTESFRVFKWSVNTCFHYVDVDTVLKLTRMGRLRMLKWIHSRIPEIIKRTQPVVMIAAESGHLLTMRWLISIGCYVNPDVTLMCATKSGQLPILKWFHKNNFDISYNIMLAALLYKRVDIVNWYWKNTPVFPIDRRILLSAARHGYIKIVSELIDIYDYEVDDDVFAAALSSGNIELLNYLHDIACPYNPEDAHYSIDSIEVIKWLFDNEYEIPQTIYVLPTWYNPEVEDWLTSHGHDIVYETDNALAQLIQLS